MSPPSSPHTKNTLPHFRKRAKDGVSPGIEPGTTRNIDLEFSRTAVTRISLSEYHTARPRDLDGVGFDGWLYDCTHHEGCGHATGFEFPMGYPDDGHVSTKLG
jgi:hypothetical protein